MLICNNFKDIRLRLQSQLPSQVPVWAPEPSKARWRCHMEPSPLGDVSSATPVERTELSATGSPARGFSSITEVGTRCRCSLRSPQGERSRQTCRCAPWANGLHPGSSHILSGWLDLPKLPPTIVPHGGRPGVRTIVYSLDL